MQHSHNGYTKESRGQTGYVTAIDVASGALMWRSPPQVANVRDFVLIGGAIVSAYGLTAEPRFLFVLDAATGAVKHRTAIRATPEVLIERAGNLY